MSLASLGPGCGAERIRATFLRAAQPPPRLQGCPTPFAQEGVPRRGAAGRALRPFPLGPPRLHSLFMGGARPSDGARMQPRENTTLLPSLNRGLSQHRHLDPWTVPAGCPRPQQRSHRPGGTPPWSLTSNQFVQVQLPALLSLRVQDEEAFREGRERDTALSAPRNQGGPVQERPALLWGPFSPTNMGAAARMSAQLLLK